MKITSASKRLSNSNIKLTITVSWPGIKKIYEKVLQEKAKEIEIPGFRKGKAPLAEAKKKIGKESLLRETLQEVLPEAYAKAVKEHQLKPLIQPKVKVVSLEESKDWQFEATTCEKPIVKLDNYQEAVKNTLRKAKIWVPGKEEKQKKEKETRNERIKELLEILLRTIKIELPQILVEDEVNRLLSRLLEQVNKLGLILDGYLHSIQKTVEQLRQEYQQQAERTLKLEFILGAIAEDLKIKVEEKEIEAMIEKSAKDKKQRSELTANKYYLASILRRQKTIDKLLNL